MKSVLFLFSAATFFVFLLAGVERAAACTCAGSSSPCGSYYRSDVVFSGKVKSSKINKIKVKTSEDREIEIAVTEFLFEIAEVFKGDAKMTEISMKGDGTTCDFPFKPDETYLVFASQTGKNEYTTGICSRTGKLSEARDEIKFLRETLPKPETEICVPDSMGQSYFRNSPLLAYFWRPPARKI